MTGQSHLSAGRGTESEAAAARDTARVSPDAQPVPLTASSCPAPGNLAHAVDHSSVPDSTQSRA